MPEAIRFTNTMTGAKEPFEPVSGTKVGFYACGPTVYNFVHIGNLSTYLFGDLLKRYLRYAGYDVTHVMNITDIEDKIIRDSQKEGVSLKEFTERYTAAFFEDLRLLNADPADVYPLATAHVPEMIALIEDLLQKGVAYEKGGSVYFSIKKFPGYGELAKLEPEAIVGGVEDKDEYERDSVRDFVLWKGWKEEDGENFWETPFGKGRPGWHIECSAMSMKYLGPEIDLHTGAIDLVFPHHQNEIAQSEAMTGKSFVRYWLHRGFLTIGEAKMAKSKGNQMTLRTIATNKLEAMVFRLFVLSSHYRSELLYSDETLKTHRANLRTFYEFRRAVETAGVVLGGPSPEVTTAIGAARAGFKTGMSDDLNAPVAFAALFEFLRAMNTWLTKGQATDDDKRDLLAFLDELDTVLGIYVGAYADYLVASAPTKEQEALIARMNEARAAKDFEASDRIREELTSQGVDIRQTKGGIVGTRNIL